MSRLGEIRHATAEALRQIDTGVSVKTWPAPQVDPPVIVIGDGDPWVTRSGGEYDGYSIREVRMRVLLGVARHTEEAGFRRLDRWIEQLDAALYQAAMPAGCAAPVIEEIGPRGTVSYAEVTLFGCFVDLLVVDQLC